MGVSVCALCCIRYTFPARPTCISSVIANGQCKLLLDGCNLEVVVDSVGPLRTRAQVKAQLIPSWSVSQFIDLFQTCSPQ